MLITKKKVLYINIRNINHFVYTVDFLQFFLYER